jgi:hypothetical protein
VFEWLALFAATLIARGGLLVKMHAPYSAIMITSNNNQSVSQTQPGPEEGSSLLSY